MDTRIFIPKKQIYVAPDLLNIKQVEERLDVKPQTVKVTWTDKFGTERNIKKLNDGHAANLTGWLRERGFIMTEMIIKAELERRCTGSYPDNFADMIKIYKAHPEIWRLKVY